MQEKNKITLILSVVIVILLTGIITLAVIDSNKTHEKDEFYKLKTVVDSIGYDKISQLIQLKKNSNPLLEYMIHPDNNEN